MAVAVLAGLMPSVTAEIHRATMTLAASDYVSTVLADHPLGYWRLGESGGTTAVDSSGNGHNGTYVGSVTLGVPALIGNGTAADFSGTGHVDLGTLSLSLPAVTLEAWIQPSTYASSSPYIDSIVGTETTNDDTALLLRLGYSGQAGNTGKPDLVATTHQGSPSAEAQNATALTGPGLTHYVVGVYKDPVLTVYVDGVAATSITANPTDGHAYGSADYWIAGDPLFGRYLTGVVGDVAIYNYALTPNQVAQHYIASSFTQPPAGAAITTAEVPTGDNFCWKCYAKRTVHGERAEPVNTATGAFFEDYTDLSIPGRGLPIAVTRSYSSARASSDGPLGYGWTHGYAMSLNPNGATGPAIVTGPDGGQTTFTLSGGTYTAPPRAQATLVKNADGTFTFTQDHRVSYTFDAAGQLTQEADLNGYATRLAYNGAGQLSSVTDPAGRAIALRYTGGHVTNITDPISRTVSYSYDGGGNLTSVTDVNGGVTSFTYDANHLLLTITDPRRNVVTTNHYDASSRIDWQKDALSRTTTFAYSGSPLSSTGGSTTITDPKGNATLDQYVSGERIAITRGYGTPQAATWQYRYDPGSLGPTVILDPNGHATSYTYDTSGNQLSATDALGRTRRSTYDTLGDLTGTTDPLGVTTTNTYDAKGNLLSTSTPLVGSSPLQQQAVTYTYGDASQPGDVTGITDPDGKVSQRAYDSDGDLTSTTDPAGDAATMTYNAVGWPLTTVSPRGNVTGGTPSQFTTTYSYADPSTGATDEFGDVRVLTDPLGHQVVKSYDADRNVISLEDGDGDLTQYTFDAANEQTDVIRADGTHLRTDYYPDASVQDQVNGAGNTTSYTYDPLGHLSSTTDPLGNVTTDTSDALGNVLTKTDPGGSCTATPRVGCTTYAYDAASQLSSITYSDGTTPNVTGLTYDADGQRTAMTDGTGTSSWTWDSLHRMTGYTTGAGSTVQFGYNLRGLETTITYPGSHAVTEGFDDTGRLSSIQDWLGNTTSFGYDPDSNLTTETMPSTSGVVDTFTFDAADRLTAISDAKGSASLFAASYTRDGNGQVTADTSAPTARTAYHYTTLNQVCYAGSTASSSCASPPVGSQPFTYDAADNLTLMGSTQQSFNAAGELCWTSVVAGTSCGSPPPGATTYTYDSRGHRTGVAAADAAPAALTYDQANRLTAYEGSAAYGYNGDGLRMSKTVSGVTTQYLWNVSGSLPLLLQDGTTSYVYGPGGLPLEQITGSPAVLFFHHDDLGSTRLLTNATGTPAATYTFDPYGNVSASTGTATNPMLFAGQYRDAETGLYYLRARYYDPATAQFVSRDPLVAITREPYAYVADDPLNKRDPSGLDNNCDTIPRPWDMEHSCAALGAASLLSDGVESAGNAIATPVYAPADTQDLACLEQQAEEEGTGWALPWLDGAGTILAVASLIDGEGEAYFAAKALTEGDDASLTVQQFIGKYLKGSVNRKMPGEYLNMTVKDALASGNSTVRKLLTNNQYRK